MTRAHRSLHGLTRTLISNMVEGCAKGFSKELEVNGVGYRASKQGKNLVMVLGFSHQVIVPEIDGITIDVPPQIKLSLTDPTSRRSVSLQPKSVKSALRSLIKARASEYVDEVIIRKEGKAGKGKK